MVKSGSVKLIAVLAFSICTVGLGTATSLAQTSIGPDQHFIGLVNGSNAPVTVYTVCAGPLWPGRRGPVAGGQTMAAAEVLRGGGDTGPFSQIYSWFVPRHHHTPTALTFTTYGTPQTIPSSIRVPCDGSGKVEFSPCPYLAPCASGWTADFVRVTFVDIAV